MSETIFDINAKRVWVAGHRGMVGSAVVRRLEREPIGELITATSDEVDLIRQSETEQFVLDTRPGLAIIAAANARDPRQSKRPGRFPTMRIS